MSPCVWKGHVLGRQGVQIVWGCSVDDEPLATQKKGGRNSQKKIRKGPGHAFVENGKFPPIFALFSCHLCHPFFSKKTRGTNAATTSNGTNGSASNKQGGSRGSFGEITTVSRRCELKTVSFYWQKFGQCWFVQMVMNRWWQLIFLK